MKIQRTHKTGCSMLVAALVGLLPIAAAHAQDSTYGQQPDSQSMGAQGPLRDDSGATFDNSGNATDQGTFSNDANQTSPNLNNDATAQPYGRGAQGPIRDDTGSMPQDQNYGNSGAQGPIRQDVDQNTVNEFGARGQQPWDRSGVDTAQPRGRSDVQGSQGPLRDDNTIMEPHRTYHNQNYQNYNQPYPYPSGAQGPLREDEAWPAYNEREMESAQPRRSGPKTGM